MKQVRSKELKFVVAAVLCLTSGYRCLAGEYRVTDAWPSGHGESFVQMSDDNRPICFAVKNAIGSNGRVDGPLRCGNDDFDTSSMLARPKWVNIDASGLLQTAIKLEIMSDESVGRSSPWPHSAVFAAQADAGILAHTLTIAKATVVLSGWTDKGVKRTSADDKLTIVRYERWGCSENINTSAPRILYFVANNPDLSDLRIIKGLPLPADVFIFNGLAYFTSRSSRFVDAHWKPLSREHPELSVHMPSSDGQYFAEICNLLYSDTKHAK
jgi:hypothetical protein